jgi:hypothetical protein
VREVIIERVYLQVTVKNLVKIQAISLKTSSPVACFSELFPILDNHSDKFLSKNLIIHPFNNYVIWPGRLALMNHELGLLEQKVCVT